MSNTVMSKQDAPISCPAPGETAGNVNSADSVSAAGKTTSAAGTAPEKKTISDKKLLEVKNICVQFGSHRHPFTAVDDVSFDIYQGETFGLVGESGSGKTTIGRAIIRINPITKGEILFDGKRISGKLSREEDQQVTRDIQMIFQDPMSSLNERAKVGYIVAEGLYAPGNRYTEEERNEKVKKALLDVGLLPEFASRFPHEFSGGQRQRIGIARALVMDPKFIVADEPISALDVSIRAQVLNLMSLLSVSSATASQSFTRERSSSSRNRKNFSGIHFILTQRHCSPRFRSRTQRWKSTRNSSSTILPCTITPSTNRYSRKSCPAISFTETRRNWTATGRKSACPPTPENKAAQTITDNTGIRPSLR